VQEKETKMKSDIGQKIKPDIDQFLINFSDGYIKCQLCNAKWEIKGRNFGLDNKDEIDTFKENHKNCLGNLVGSL
jgi:hypothetical protein